MARIKLSGANQNTYNGSAEQAEIWRVLSDESTNVIVDAVAGSGKTYTGVEWCKRQQSGRIAYVAFNKHIAIELQSKLNSNRNVEAMTYHSLGLRMIRKVRGKVDIDQYKVDGILDTITLPVESDYKEKTAKYRIRNLVSLAKQYGVRSREELEILVDHHGVEIDGIEDVVYKYTPIVLDKCKDNIGTIDFDDMVWLPKELGLNGTRYDTMLIDEAQDTNLSQQWIALNSANRLVVIGDKHQAIYGFRGSDHLSMSRIETALQQNYRGVIRLPLTVTRRCPKSHVGLAQTIVPHIKALEGALEGIIAYRSSGESFDLLQPGDLVLCRVNADLIGVAYRLLRKGVKAIVRGKDIGKGIDALIDKSIKRGSLESSDKVDKLLGVAGELTNEDISKFLAIPKDRGAMQAAAAQDKMDCLIQLAENSSTISELRGVIARLFADFTADGKPNDAVVLGTVHRTKGLEAERVFILRPDLIPHPMARQKWQAEQERNLAYVAVTRSKQELTFVGGESPLFMKG